MPRSARRRAAASLSWGAACFVALHLAAQAWLPERLETFRDLDYVVRRDRLAALGGLRRDAPLAVALGSSRTLNGFDGAAASRALQQALGHEPVFLNLGSPGGEAGHSLVNLGRLIRDRLLPDVVFVEACPTFLGEGPLMETFDASARKLSAADRAWLAGHGFPVDPALVPERGGPTLLSYRREALAALLPWLEVGDSGAFWVYNADRFGGVPKLPHRYTAAQRAETLEATRANFQPVMPTLRFRGATLQALRAALEECRARGVRTALVVAPEGPVFRSWHPAESRAAARDVLRSLAAETGAALVDAWDWFDEEAFLDSHHLFQPAAAEFTARAVREAAAQWGTKSSAPSSAPPAGPAEPVRAQAAAGAADSAVRR